MISVFYKRPKIRRKTHAGKQRGIALITTLLLLMLLTAMSLAMVLSVSSDMLINGYYGNDRGSFYAADSGAAIARQALVTAIEATAPANFAGGVAPIPQNAYSQAQSSVSSTYGAWTSTTGPSGSWPEKFQITNVNLSANYGCTPSGGPSTSCTNLVAPYPTSFTYTFPYTFTAVGQAQGTEAVTLVDSGNLIITANITQSGSSKRSFASFGTFLDQYGDCQAPFVPGTLTGPFFTNGQWNFGDSNALGSSTKYVFTDAVGQVGSNTSWWHGNSCDDAAGSSDSANGSTIAPTFQNTFSQSQNPIPLPTDDYNQKQAVLDGIGNSSTPPSSAQMHSVLKNVSGTAYPSSGTPSSGVYLPYSVDATTGKKTITGGGILVEGNANVTLSPSGTNGETYTIVQNGVTTTVTVDPTANTTTISSGGVTNTVTGVPAMYDPSTGAFVQDATMLYVDGNINSLSGPGEYQPAVNNGVALTITSAQTMTVTGDIRYASEPVYTSGSNLDQLNPSGNTGQVLGLFTATGDIQMNNSQSDGNLQIDASLAMISQGGTGGWINVGPHINTLNVVGGRIANKAKSGNTTTRNIFYDRRFSQGGFAPPWFPSTTVTVSGVDSAQFLPATIKRLQWSYQTANQ
jgi:Tfp pilus assembly protein PilX